MWCYFFLGLREEVFHATARAQEDQTHVKEGEEPTAAAEVHLVQEQQVAAEAKIDQDPAYTEEEDTDKKQSEVQLELLRYANLSQLSRLQEAPGSKGTKSVFHVRCPFFLSQLMFCG
jgi:hypothetical protein